MAPSRPPVLQELFGRVVRCVLLKVTHEGLEEGVAALGAGAEQRG